MTIPELVKYNKRCNRIDKYLLFKTKKTKKHRRTKNKKIEKQKRKEEELENFSPKMKN